MVIQMATRHRRTWLHHLAFVGRQMIEVRKHSIHVVVHPGDFSLQLILSRALLAAAAATMEVAEVVPVQADVIGRIEVAA